MPFLRRHAGNAGNAGNAGTQAHRQRRHADAQARGPGCSKASQRGPVFVFRFKETKRKHINTNMVALCVILCLAARASVPVRLRDRQTVRCGMLQLSRLGGTNSELTHCYYYDGYDYYYCYYYAHDYVTQFPLASTYLALQARAWTTELHCTDHVLTSEFGSAPLHSLSIRARLPSRASMARYAVRSCYQYKTCRAMMRCAIPFGLFHVSQLITRPGALRTTALGDYSWRVLFRHPSI